MVPIRHQKLISARDTNASANILGKYDIISVVGDGSGPLVFMRGTFTLSKEYNGTKRSRRAKKAN